MRIELSMRLASTAALVALCGCLSVPGSSRNQAEFSGWFQQAGEFRLYRRSEDLGKLYDRSCISGRILDRAKQEQAEQHNGQRVIITGWTAEYDQLTLEGAPFIENYCAARLVLYATDIRRAD